MVTVVRYTCEVKDNKNENAHDTVFIVPSFKNIRESLSTANWRLFYVSRLVISTSLQSKILEILRLGHYGIQIIYLLARTAVY